MDAHLAVVRNELDRSRRFHTNGAEYWMARDLQPILGYAEWRTFRGVIEKAKMACESTGIDPADHFVGAHKLVEVGSGAQAEREDYFLSRYACYLVAMNGDPRKPVIGAAQTYFAIQTRRQEKFDELTESEKRIAIRERVRNHNRQLAGAAREAGVRSERFGIFQDAGYRGLYGGLAHAEIKREKNIPESESLLDRAGRAELAANDFRITQTEEKLRKEKIQGETPATDAHHEVGQEVRTTIQRIGGTLPEDLPPEPHIKKLRAGRKQSRLKP